MKASELRIGLTVLLKGEVTRVYQIEHRYKSMYRINDIDVDEKYIHRVIQPVQLNIEWLLRLGFTTKTEDKYGNWNFWNKEKDASIDIDITIASTHIEPLFYYRIHEEIRRKPLQYVHQLQNLYFALTGQELTLKETPTEPQQ